MAIEELGFIDVDSSGNAKVKRTASYTFSDNDKAGVLVKTGAGRVKGIFVSSAATTPTLKLWDETGPGTTTLVETFTPAAATMYNFGVDAEFTTGLYVSQGGCVSCTVFYE